MERVAENYYNSVCLVPSIVVLCSFTFPGFDHGETSWYQFSIASEWIGCVLLDVLDFPQTTATIHAVFSSAPHRSLRRRRASQR